MKHLIVGGVAGILIGGALMLVLRPQQIPPPESPPLRPAPLEFRCDTDADCAHLWGDGSPTPAGLQPHEAA